MELGKKSLVRNSGGNFANALYHLLTLEKIIVIAGSPHEPMTRSVATDLERRGFIIFITVTSPEEERVVHSENREDIRPLWLDPTSVRIHSSLRMS